MSQVLRKSPARRKADVGRQIHRIWKVSCESQYFSMLIVTLNQYPSPPPNLMKGNEMKAACDQPGTTGTGSGPCGDAHGAEPARENPPIKVSQQTTHIHSPFTFSGPIQRPVPKLLPNLFSFCILPGCFQSPKTRKFS